MKLFLQIVLGTISLSLFSQKILNKDELKDKGVDVNWTSSISEESTYNTQEVRSFQASNGDIYTFRLDPMYNHIEVACFDNNMSLKYTLLVEDELKLEGDKYRPIGGTLIQDKPHLIVHKITEDNLVLGAVEILSTGKLNKTAQFLDPINVKIEKEKAKFAGKVDMKEWKNSAYPEVSLNTSPNGKFNFIICRKGGYFSDFQSLTCLMLDDAFSKLSEGTTTVPIKYDDYNVENSLVTNSGAGYFVLSKSKAMLNLKTIITLSDNNLQKKDFKFGFTPNYIRLFETKSNKIKIGTTVMEGGKSKNAKGLFFAELDTNINLTNYHHFDKDFFTKNKQIHTDLSLYTVADINEVNNGFFVSLEQYERQNVKFTYGAKYDVMQGGMKVGSMGSVSSVNLVNKIFNNVMIVKFDKHDSLQWANIIEKEQTFASSNFVNYAGSSFIPVSDTSMGVLFNDLAKNYEPNSKFDKNVSSLANAVLAIKIVSQNQIEASSLIGGKEEKANMKVPSFSKLSNTKLLMHGNEIVAMGKKTKKSKYGLLSVSETNFDKKMAIQSVKKPAVSVPKIENIAKIESPKSLLQEIESSKPSAHKDSSMKKSIASAIDLKKDSQLAKNTTPPTLATKSVKDTSVDATKKSNKKIVATKKPAKQIDSAKIKELAAVVRPVMDTTRVPIPEFKPYQAPVSPRINNPSVEYYTKLRKKFEQDAIEAKAKQDKEAIENAQKLQKIQDSRHIKPEDAALFDKYRYSDGNTNPTAPKKSAEQEYQQLFK